MFQSRRGRVVLLAEVLHHLLHRDKVALGASEEAGQGSVQAGHLVAQQVAQAHFRGTAVVPAGMVFF